MTPPSFWGVIALVDMMISQNPGAFSYPQKAILDKSDNRKWFGVSIDEFMNTLNEYLYWYNGKGIKI